jgi:hypothetical protein
MRLRTGEVIMLDHSVPLQKIAVFGLITALLLTSSPFLLFDILRVRSVAPIDYNEGWMVIHTSRLLAGQPLYLPLSDLPLTPVNYPPLSFVLVGALSYFTGSILLAGRLFSFLSFLLVAYLTYGIIFNFTSKRSAALLGALLWLALMVQNAGHYVGMYDPQMLGHAFSMASLYLYSKWIDELTPTKISVLAILCCLALFTKHLLIAVPITLAITLYVTNRKAFFTFAFVGTCFGVVFVLGSWIYGGGDFFANFLDLDRQVSSERMSRRLLKLFYGQHLWVLFIPFVMLLVGRSPSKWLCILTYFSFSFLLGSYVSRAVGVDTNAWFDFFIAAAIVFGIFATGIHDTPTVGNPFFRPVQKSTPHTPRSVTWTVWRNPIMTYGILALCLLPFLLNTKTKLKPVLNYEELRQQEVAYKKEVLLLKSIPGPVLYEELLLGFEAGKELLVDPFNVAQMIVSGRMPEEILTDPIRTKYFSAIILTFDVEKKLADRSQSISERWTNNTLITIRDHYKLFTPEDPHQHYFYVPR